jgi:hypothetical protein
MDDTSGPLLLRNPESGSRFAGLWTAMTADRRTHGFRKVSSKLNAGPEGQANAQPEALEEGKHWRQ